MEGMTSDRTRKAIASIRSTLAIYQRGHVPGAAGLARRARERSTFSVTGCDCALLTEQAPSDPSRRFLRVSPSSPHCGK